MSDITKCATPCSKKLHCHRYTAPQHKYRQSMAAFKPDPATGVCSDFWPNKVADMGGVSNG